MPQSSVEQLILRIQTMGREDVVTLLQDMPYDFPMDFSPDFLASCTVEKLRHILLAACLYAQRRQEAAGQT